MNYTVVTRPQVVPKYVIRSEAGKQVSRLNPIPPIEKPTTFGNLIYSPMTANQNIIYDNNVVELWEDTAGTATWTDIKTNTGVIAYLQSVVKAEAKQVIEKKWPLWSQNNCSLGIYSSTIIAQCKTDIAAVISASNTAEDNIANAASLDVALTIKASWPTL